MPLNVRRFFASATLVLIGIGSGIAQDSVPESSNQAIVPNAQTAVKTVAAPTSAEVMRERISKAKAYIAVKNYNAAIYELENIRRETKEPAVHSVLNVLLMNSYLEQGDYKRAQDFLTELYNPQKSTKPIPSPFYFAVAGQVVKGARNQFERYRALGLSVQDRNLPLEATVDIEKMRETLETVIEQSKKIGADKAKTADAMALLEEATASRGIIARDDYDAKRWKEEVGDAREMLTSSRSTVLSAVNETPTETTAVSTTAANNPPVAENKTNDIAFNPVPNTTTASKSSKKPSKENKSNEPKVKQPKEQPKEEAKVNQELIAQNTEPVKETPKTVVEERKEEPKEETNKPTRTRVIETQTADVKNETPSNISAETTAILKDASPLNVGSLLEYATKQSKPVYPPAARTIRQSGVVKVEVVIDESGEVSEVQTSSGPSMLQSAAKDAIRKWKFKPFMRDGQPVKATGFINFNFAL
ncbi:MAG TPA: energy transducer TonB [Pyrinomonadaceae bacterium]|nr:energy transducer TonB [Pyrinomonadaceae bacterium]